MAAPCRHGAAHAQAPGIFVRVWLALDHQHPGDLPPFREFPMTRLAGARASRPLVTLLAGARLAIAVLALLVAPARAAETNPFFAGKTVRILVGFSAGGGYDL